MYLLGECFNECEVIGFVVLFGVWCVGQFWWFGDVGWVVVGCVGYCVCVDGGYLCGCVECWYGVFWWCCGQ